MAQLLVENYFVMLEASYGRSLVTIKHSAGLEQDSSRMTFFSTRNLILTHIEKQRLMSLKWVTYL
ncbi:hypothetical protein L0337_00775 [candidate division KSB1 bacterium]|nr:hypothetical protein [candidate division KSB1 bacterium]